MSLHILTADWIVPVMSPPLRGGTITVHDGRIVAVEKHGRSKATHNYEGMALLPAFVNAHTHLDLTGAAGLFPPVSPITDWLQQVVGYRPTRSAEQVKEDIDSGIRQLVNSGTGLVGDISCDGGSHDPLRRSKLSGVVFRELIGLGAERGTSVAKRGREWMEQETSSMLRGLSPHASYSAGRSIFNSLKSTDVLCTHLAESREELELLEHHTGPFVPYLQSLGAWHPSELLTIDEILSVAHRVKRFVIAHGNYLTLEQWRSLPKSASVVYCPRTHSAFGHGTHPYQHMLRDGVIVALGTDSLASNPDLSVWNEAKYLFAKGVDPKILLEMLTINGSKALGLDDQFGSLEPDKRADIVRVSIENAELDSIFRHDATINWIRGVRSEESTH
jgi:aminodeoxyfutalosine deaminase